MPISVSKPQGGTVRCLALDSELLISGGTDSLIRIWQARPGSKSMPSDAKEPLFDLSATPR